MLLPFDIAGHRAMVHGLTPGLQIYNGIGVFGGISDKQLFAPFIIAQEVPLVVQ